MITLSIDFTKVDKSQIKPHKNGSEYLSLVLFENKEERENGEQTPIIGNWRYVKGKSNSRGNEKPSGRRNEEPDNEPISEDEIPF